MKKYLERITPLRHTLVFAGAAGLLALCAHEIDAQAWVQRDEGYYFKLSASYLFTAEEFDSLGNKREFLSADASTSDAWFREASVTAYVEYGLTDDFTLVLTVPFKVVTTRETSDPGIGPASRITRTNGGLSDLLASIRAPIVQGPYAVSLQGGVKIPLGYESQPDNGGPSLGTGAVDAEIGLFAGVSLYPLPAYLSGGIGYRFRGGESTFTDPLGQMAAVDLHDELPFNVEAGYTWKDLFAKLRLEGIKNTEDPAGSSQPGVGDQDIYKLMPTVQFAFTDHFAVVGEMFHAFAGKNTVSGSTYSLGVVFIR